MMFLAAVSCEFLKLRRAPIVWLLAGAFALTPLMVGLMMSVLLHPGFGRRLGLMTAKAQMTIPAATWPVYLTLIATVFAGGVIVLAVAQAYIFGREYAERTAGPLLSLPVSRVTLLGAKLTVSAVWFAAMAAAVYAEAWLVGVAIGLPGYAPGLLAASLARVGLVVLEVLLAGSVAAWLAVVGRGYLAPVGVSVLLLLIGDLFAHSGWAGYVPWSIVFTTAGAAGGVAPAPASIAVLVAFFLVAAVATWLAMDRSDVL